MVFGKCRLFLKWKIVQRIVCERSSYSLDNHQVSTRSPPVQVYFLPDEAAHLMFLCVESQVCEVLHCSAGSLLKLKWDILNLQKKVFVCVLILLQTDTDTVRLACAYSESHTAFTHPLNQHSHIPVLYRRTDTQTEQTVAYRHTYSNIKNRYNIPLVRPSQCATFLIHAPQEN